VLQFAEHEVSGKVVHAFRPDGSLLACAGDPVDMINILNEPRTLYLCDSIMPARVDAVTVLITSPAVGAFRKWMTHATAHEFYLPVPDWDEMLMLRRIAFPSKDETLMQQQFDIAGGSARMLLDPRYSASLEATQEKLSEAVKRVSMQVLNDVVLDPAVIGKLTGHTAIRIITKGELSKMQHASDPRAPELGFDDPRYYAKAAFEPITSWVSDRILDELLETEMEKTLRMMRALSDIGDAKPFYGNLFQTFALKALRAGGTFAIKRLTPGGSFTAGSMQLESRPYDRKSYTNTSHLQELVQAELRASPHHIDRTLRLPAHTTIVRDHSSLHGAPASAVSLDSNASIASSVSSAVSAEPILFSQFVPLRKNETAIDAIIPFPKRLQTTNHDDVALESLGCTPAIPASLTVSPASTHDIKLRSSLDESQGLEPTVRAMFPSDAFPDEGDIPVACVLTDVAFRLTYKPFPFAQPKKCKLFTYCLCLFLNFICSSMR
jgi:hypothetical protein